MKKYEYILIDLDDTIFDFKKGEFHILKKKNNLAWNTLFFLK